MGNGRFFVANSKPEADSLICSLLSEKIDVKAYPKESGTPLFIEKTTSEIVSFWGEYKTVTLYGCGSMDGYLKIHFVGTKMYCFSSGYDIFDKPPTVFASTLFIEDLTKNRSLIETTLKENLSQFPCLSKFLSTNERSSDLLNIKYRRLAISPNGQILIGVEGDSSHSAMKKRSILTPIGPFVWKDYSGNNQRGSWKLLSKIQNSWIDKNDLASFLKKLGVKNGTSWDESTLSQLVRVRLQNGGA